MTKAAGGLVDVADLGTDTGWITIPLIASVTASAGYHFSYRKLNGVVYIQGRITGLAVGATTTITSSPLPAGFRPDIPLLDLQIAAISTSAPSRIVVTSAGDINVTAGQGTVGINSSFIPAA